MNEARTVNIWNPETGIADLTAPWLDLAASEIPGIAAVWRAERDRLDGTPLLADFTERLGREWAIETGIIENLYDIDRGVTQTLIEHGFRAELMAHGSTDQPRDYVLRLLADQKAVLDGLFAFVKDERSLSNSYVKELHAAMLRSQTYAEGVDSLGRRVDVRLSKGAWKTLPNSPIRNGVIYAYCPPERVADEMERLVALHLDHVVASVPADVQAAWLHHRFTQIHPFQDGNGRVARALASLVLIKNDLFPLVVTRDDRARYLDALEAADRGSLDSLVRLIADLQNVQVRKAVGMAETVRTERAGVDAMLARLGRAAGEKAEARLEAFGAVFEIAEAIESNLYERLEVIAPDVRNVLLRLNPSAEVWSRAADHRTGHYYRAQIIETARDHLGYFVDFGDYRSWVALNMRWERWARLVFAVHGIGRRFTGCLICAPFFEFRDKDEDEETRTTLVPVAREGFLFFYNETIQTTLKRFEPWRERVLETALSELAQNL